MRISHFLAVLTVLPILSSCQSGGTSTPQDTARFYPAVPMPAATLSKGKTVTRIALGSCYHPWMPSEIFNEIVAQGPDAFVFLGDNVYALDESDDPTLTSLREAYGKLGTVESFGLLRQATPLLVAWDDHDYGKDDAGAEFEHKAFSESLYEYAWDIRAEDERAKRPGVYFERTVGPAGKRVQFITLDTRFFRNSLTRHPDQDIGRYTESKDPDQSILGETQWRWFEQQLSKPADIRIIITTIQLIADGHHWEAWRMMPLERERFYKLLSTSQANGVVVVSGDRHSAAIYSRPDFKPYPLYELTTSSLNVPLTSFVKDPVDEPGPHRLGKPYYESNYGLIDIDWDAGQLTMRLMDDSSQIITQETVDFVSLQP